MIVQRACRVLSNFFFLIFISLFPPFSPSYASTDYSLEDTQTLGGKASNLVILHKVPGIVVPEWLCIPTDACHDFFSNNGVYDSIESLDVLCQKPDENLSEITTLSAQIQQAILRGSFNTQWGPRIQRWYDDLSIGGSFSVAVRSSGVLEDQSHASFAGLYDTFLNQKGIEDVLTAIKRVWASSFNIRVIMERAKAGVSQDQCLIAVIVQRMVRARAAGVASSIEISTNYPGVEVSANFGPGESAVGGELAVDKWLVHSTNRFIIKSMLGNKTHYFSLTDDGQGTIRRQTDEFQQKTFCLSPDEVLLVADCVNRVRSHYHCDVDVEFAFDVDGTLYILQARPLVVVSPSKLSVVDPDDVGRHTVISRGDYSVPGVVHGRLKWIDKWEDLANKTIKIEPDDIVVTYVVINFWSHYLTQFKGLITKQGGPTTHPILLCRERNVPCLIGIGDDFERLRAYSGKMVTLDGVGRAVYEGEVALKETSSVQMREGFEVVRVRPWKGFTDRVFELTKGGYAVSLDGKYWLRQPTFPLTKLFQDLYVQRKIRLPFLIQGHTECNIETRVIDDYVCSVIKPAEEYVRPFYGMTLDECEAFCSRFDINLHEVQRLALQARLDPELWQRYVDTTSDLFAFNWISEIFRMYVDRQAEILASELGVPQHYFDECSSYIQSLLEEEDTFMQRDLYALAHSMVELQACPDIDSLRRSYPDVYGKVEDLAKQYRFTSNSSIENELPLSLVYKRLTDEIQQIKDGKPFSSMKRTGHSRFYFPQNPDLYRWLKLSITSRVIQSNSHHQTARLQWLIRDELLKLGTYWTDHGKLSQPQEIFHRSLEEVGELIKQRGGE